MSVTEEKPLEQWVKQELLDEYLRLMAAIPEPQIPGEWVLAQPNRAAKGAMLQSVIALRAVEQLLAPEDEPEVVEAVAVELDPEVDAEIGNALALREKAVEPTSAIPSSQEWNAMATIAAGLYQTTFVPDAYRGKQPDVLAAMMFGREIGLGPMLALRDVYMIDGRPALAAHRQLALLRKGGIVILESEVTKERAWIRAQRQDTGEIMAVEFTYEEASNIRRKGKPLVDGDNWKNYPSDMLWARAVGRLTRRLGPDLIGGLPPYVAEEVADFEGWGVAYDAVGAVQLQRAYPESRKDLDYNFAESWVELTERMEGRLGKEEAHEWMRQAIIEAGGKPIEGLTSAERQVMFGKLCHVLKALDDEPGDLAFRGDLRDFLARTFAAQFEGIALVGPPWRISAGEDQLPTKAQALGTEDEPVDPDAEQIPFGEGGEGYGG